MADRQALWFRRVKWAQIVLSAVTTGGAIAVIFDRNSPYFTYGTALLSVASLIFNSYLKDLDPGEAAQKHRETASDLWNIRESYLCLLADIKDKSFTMEGLRGRRDDLQKQLYRIYRIAPHTDGKAYADAQDALKNKEDLTFTDVEIDQLLPTSLKRLDNPKT
jgi:hypothetical protein